MPVELENAQSRFASLRGDPSIPPELSVVIPVNAQGDLDDVLCILKDLARYQGRHTLEVVLMVNNYLGRGVPSEIDTYRSLGLKVATAADVRRPGEAVGFTARVRGIREASAANAVSFDADCRIPDPTALLDWYFDQFQAGAEVAYTHVGYYELRDRWSVRARVLSHHAARWVKRVVLGIPTTRGSNYGVRCATLLKLYDGGMLADELNVAPTVKALGGKIAYSGSSSLTVLTSGRMLLGGWLRLVHYLHFRLLYNLRVLPVGRDVAQRTGRDQLSQDYANRRPIA